MAKPDGGPAFPTNREDWAAGFGGMSLHAFYKGLAMLGILVSEQCHPKTQQCSNEEIADAAEELADAMLADKKRREETP